MKYLILLLLIGSGLRTQLKSQTGFKPVKDTGCYVQSTCKEYDFYAKALVEMQAGRITIHDLNEVVVLCKENLQAAEVLLADKIKEYNACNASYLAEKTRADKAAKNVRFWRNGWLVAVCVAVIEFCVLILKP